MRAEIIREEQGYTATFERQLTHSKKQVWEMLTNNEKLQQWFSELKMEEAEEGGVLRFDMGDGTFEEMPITDYEKEQVLAYQWGEDHVRFELKEENGGTKLFLIETISKMTPHTPKDLAGWHVRLDAIEAILGGKQVERKEKWEYWYPEYRRLLESMSVSFE